MIYIYISMLALLITAFSPINYVVKAVFLLLLGYILIIKIKEILNEKTFLTKKMLKSLVDGNYEKKIAMDCEKEYELAVDKIKDKEFTIKKTMKEVASYREELNITYKNLLAKSTELEYSNSLLEKRVASLANLNAVGKSVLSELDLDMIISIILDSYFVLTGARKIVLYLWENGVLVQKALRGNIIDNRKTDYENIRMLRETEKKDSYFEIASELKNKDEGVIIAELSAKGNLLGGIFIIEDLLEGKLTKDELEMVAALSIHVAIAINNSMLHSEVAVKERMEKELSMASDIQNSLLPQDIKMVFGMEIANYFSPAKEIGGDYYDYFISAEGMFGVAIGDVSGKGMPAALMMAIIRAILRTLSSYDISPKKVLKKLNKAIYQDMNEEMFVTLFYTIYDYEKEILYISNAGHTPLLLARTDEDCVREETIKGMAIGFTEDYVYREKELKLQYNDVLVYYTDGITEAEDENKNLFGLERLKKVIFENKEKSAEAIKKEILNKIRIFRKSMEQNDDITLVVMKLKR